MASVLITRYKESIADRKDKEVAHANAEKEQAFKDYNIMMGNLEDPEEDEEDE